MSTTDLAPATGLGRFVALAVDDPTAEDERDFELVLAAMAGYVDRNLRLEREAGCCDEPRMVVRELADAMASGELDPRSVAGDVDPASAELVTRMLSVAFSTLAELDPHVYAQRLADLDAAARQNGVRDAHLERERAKAALLLQWCHQQGNFELLLQMPGLLDTWEQLLEHHLERRAMARRYGWTRAGALCHRRQLALQAAALAGGCLELQPHEHDPPPPVLRRCSPIRRHGPPAGSCASAPMRARTTRPVSSRRALSRRSAAPSS